jgi:hypothetical protein
MGDGFLMNMYVVLVWMMLSWTLGALLAVILYYIGVDADFVALTDVFALIIFFGGVAYYFYEEGAAKKRKRKRSNSL